MEFCEINESNFAKFASRHPNKSFLQTPEIAKLRQKQGWDTHYLAVKSGTKLLAATLVVSKPSLFGKRYFYAPGGPLIDYENRELLAFFTREIRHFLQSKNALYLQIDPYYEIVERDRDGKIVKNGFDHRSVIKNLQQLGYKPSLITSEPRCQFALSLENTTEKDLFASFKQNTRNLISRAEKKHVKVIELTKNDLKRFKKITDATSKRRDFVDKSLEYYETMYDLFHPTNQVKFILAEVDIDGKSTDLAAAMFMTYGDEVIYLFSGSDAKYMHEYNAQYAIQWYMIQYALKHGFKRYNFYGIQGLPNPKSPGYGIYRFKKGFGGRVLELLPDFDLPISKLYFCHRLLVKLKNVVKR